MNRVIPLMMIVTFYTGTLIAQMGQFAVVRPSGTTYICPTWDSAYSLSADNDIIYLPGKVINGLITINKRLTIIGAGHYSDSTFYTGKTVFIGPIYLEKKCTLEGFEVANHIAITSPNASNCSFIRIKTTSLWLDGTDNHFIDGSVILNILAPAANTSGCNYSSSNIFIKNSIFQGLERLQYSSIKNCILLGSNGNISYLIVANSDFSNCIFRGRFYADWGFQSACFPLNGNACNNSIWYSLTGVTIPGQNNYLTDQPDTLMINSGLTGEFFGYTYNYHLRPNNIYYNGGDDGSQIGIYGSGTPYKEGAVPSNPHIYFKQVAPETNNSGQLNIHFKVRTNN